MSRLQIGPLQPSGPQMTMQTLFWVSSALNAVFSDRHEISSVRCKCRNINKGEIKYGVAHQNLESHWEARLLVPRTHSLCSCASRICVCIKSGSLSFHTAWRDGARDCLRQTGESRSYVGISVWQMRQRLMTCGPCRVKDSLRHANKSLLFPPEMRYLWFGEDNYWVSRWHVFQGRTVHFNVLWLSVSTQLSATVPSACSRKHLGAVFKHGHTFGSFSDFIEVYRDLVKGRDTNPWLS